MKLLKEMNVKIKILNENKTIEYKQTRIEKFQPFIITSQPFIMKISTCHHESKF